MSFVFLLRVVWLSDRGGSLVSQSRGAVPLCREQPGHLVALASACLAVSCLPNPGGNLMADPGYAGGTMSPSPPGDGLECSQ